MLALEDDGRLELEHIMMRSFGTEQDAIIFHALDDICRFPISRFQTVRIPYEFDTEEQA